MTPDDANGHLPPDQRPLRVLVVAASDRRQYSCPGVDSKARTLMLRMADPRLKWRELPMSAGRAEGGSSPAVQQQLGLNRNATFSPEASERDRRY